MVANDDNDSLVLICSIEDVIRTKCTSPSSAAGPSGYSYNTCMIISNWNRQSTATNNIPTPPLRKVFPTTWKHAKVLPLCKGEDDATVSSSYKPISLCSCHGKLLERIFKGQLVSFISNNQSIAKCVAT